MSSPPGTAHTTIATWALAIQRALQGYGIEAVPLMLEAGIDPRVIRDPELRVAVVNMWKLWRLCVERTGDDSFGLQVAANLYPTHLNALIFALQASSTLRGARSAAALCAGGHYHRGNRGGREPCGVALILGSDSSGSAQRPFFPVDAFMGVLFRTFASYLEPVLPKGCSRFVCAVRYLTA